MKSIRQILNEREETRGKFSKHEFQVYGYNLAEQLGDLRHKSLYIKLAKEDDRNLLEAAMDFVKESSPRNKAKLFMWKLKELRSAPSSAKATAGRQKVTGVAPRDTEKTRKEVGMVA